MFRGYVYSVDTFARPCALAPTRLSASQVERSRKPGWAAFPPGHQRAATTAHGYCPRRGAADELMRVRNLVLAMWVNGQRWGVQLSNYLGSSGSGMGSGTSVGDG